MKMEDVKIYKPYEEYNEEELNTLPKIEEEKLNSYKQKYGFVPLTWNGRKWVLCLEACI